MGVKEICIDHITVVIVFVFYRQITAGYHTESGLFFKFKSVRAMDDDLDMIVSLPDELHKDTGRAKIWVLLLGGYVATVPDK